MITEKLIYDLETALEFLEEAEQALWILHYLLSIRGLQRLPDSKLDRYSGFLIQQALLSHESTVDLLQVWPSRLCPDQQPPGTRQGVEQTPT